jgi:hypothetical protein
VPTSTPVPIQALILPSLQRARTEGFQLLAGHPPFTVDFSADVQGGLGELHYLWDFDGDGTPDGETLDPEPFTYVDSGEYTATLTVTDEAGQTLVTSRRIVVIGGPDWPDWRYGLTAHLDYVPEFYANRTEVEWAAAMIRELGVDVVRHDLLWTKVQPTEDLYRWGIYDFLVDLSQRYEFDLLPIIAYSAEWASVEDDPSAGEEWFFTPPATADYAWLAYQAASRYRGRVQAWQVWNEPNLSLFWRPTPDPVRYTELLRHAYLAVKYGDPHAVVVLGGLANDESATVPQYVWHDPEAFLQAIYDAGGGPYFDAAARHPYTNPNDGVDALRDRMERFRAVMLANGDAHKPIWVTESGYSALRDSRVSDELQAEWVAQQFDALLGLDYVGPVFWYNLREKGSDPRVWEHHYGLIEYDWDPKLAYQAYRAYTYAPWHNVRPPIVQR